MKTAVLTVVATMWACVAEVPAAGFAAGNLVVGERFRNPVGFYDAAPTFSWQLPADGSARAQTAYRIVAASEAGLLPDRADLWDSGKVSSDRSVWVPYGGKPLASRQRVTWQVQVWDQDGRESLWGEPASFELGLLENSDWQAKWIRMGKRKAPASGATAPKIDLASGKASGGSAAFAPEYLRREFEVDGNVARARLHVTAKTPYHKRMETLTYDVTGMLRKGGNAIGAILGEGWYAGGMMGKKSRYPATKPLLLVQLEITLSGGGTKVVVTDDSWKATNDGPIRFSSIYHGENYDAGMEMPGWNAVGFDDSKWAGVIAEEAASGPALVPKRHYPVRATEELKTVKVTEPSPGRHVFDLGQNMVGWPRLRIPVEKGKRVTVRVAEMLEKDGNLYTANYRAARSTDTYTAPRTETVTWHPTFTFHGFRYVELTGLPEDSRPVPDWVTGVVLHSGFPRTGRFTSSHELLNRLYSNILWGQRGNFLDIPTDCPQRNERLGWTGDAQVFCPISLFNYDVHSFWMSWLQSVREEQHGSGLITHVVPQTGTGQGSPGWGDVAVTAPWNVYVRTGDRRVLEENYGMMTKWLGAYEREARGFIVGRGGYGDWLQPYARDRKSDTPMNVIATAYFGYCTALTRDAARVLGRAEDAERYAKQFANIRAAFSKAFFDASGKLTTPQQTQTAYLMALGFDLLEPGLRAGAVKHLLTLIEAAGGHLRTGFLGTPLIASVLDREGYTDAAYGVLFKETYPSWFYSIHQGATTMWERWNSYSHDKGFGDAGMNSFNHYAYGAIGQWMVERIAGLAPDPAHPGYKHFFIQPAPGGPLTHARAELDTPYGTAASGWEKTDAGWIVHAVVPPNTTATVYVPARDAASVMERGQPAAKAAGVKFLRMENNHAVYAVGSGTYRFRSTLPETVK
ncbi:MAG: family 78 glycoside hydrolase catalytic domain [Kiritimatiellaeota bacterium]|nr:family 78 glycoside hydrolase catalytic domain [Kiritimatiellota bacterium]